MSITDPMVLADHGPGAVASSDRPTSGTGKAKSPGLAARSSSEPPHLVSAGRWPCAHRRISPRGASQAPASTATATAWRSAPAPSPEAPTTPAPPDPPQDRRRDPPGEALGLRHRGDPRPPARAPPQDPPHPRIGHGSPRDLRVDPQDRLPDPRRPARQPPPVARPARDRGLGSGGPRGCADPRKLLGDRPPRIRPQPQQDPPPCRAPGRRRPRRDGPDHPRHLRAGRRTART